MTRESWNEKYRGAPVWVADPAEPLVREVRSIPWMKHQRDDAPRRLALDLGSGEGRHARFLAAEGFRVVAIDYSDVAVQRARQAAEFDEHGSNITWISLPIEQYAPPRRVDLIVVAYLQLPTQTLGPILSRAAKWLRQDGRLIVLGHDITNLDSGRGGPQDPSKLHDLDALLPFLTGDRSAGGAACELVRAEVLERYEAESVSDTTERPALDTLIHVRRPVDKQD